MSTKNWSELSEAELWQEIHRELALISGRTAVLTFDRECLLLLLYSIRLALSVGQSVGKPEEFGRELVKHIEQNFPEDGAVRYWSRSLDQDSPDLIPLFPPDEPD